MSRKESFKTKETRNYSVSQKVGAVVGAIAIALSPACKPSEAGVRHYSSNESKGSSELYGDDCANNERVVAQLATSGYAPLIDLDERETLKYMNRSAPNALDGYSLTPKHINQISSGVALLQENIIETAEAHNISYRMNILSDKDTFIRGDDFDICMDAGESNGVNLNKNLNNYHGE